MTKKNAWIGFGTTQVMYSIRNAKMLLMITKYLIKNSKELSRKSDEIDRISQINERKS